jgi:hypothetical protein
MLVGDVEVLLKNGGERLSEAQKKMLNSIFLSSNFQVTILESSDDGIYSAMNQALQYSIDTGILEFFDWVWFLNAGDKLEDYSYSDFIELQDVPRSCLMLCGDPTRGLQIGFNETEFIDPHEFLSGRIVIGHQVALFRPEVFYKFGLYDDNKKISSDYILMHKILSGSSITKTRFPKIDYEDNGISRVKLVTQEFEKIAYVAQVARKSFEKRTIMLLFYKTFMLLKHIIKRGLKSLSLQEIK